MAISQICAIPDCGKPSIAGGWCSSHYYRAKRYGDPMGGTRPPSSRKESTICSIDGCSGLEQTAGYCRSHYKRLRRHGDPLGGGTYLGEPEQWLKNHIGYQGDGCLHWPFSSGIAGYGILHQNGVASNASRVMCILAHGEPPTPEHEAGHNCGRGHEGCVHPGHLQWKTKEQNEADKKLHGTDNRGERHPLHKLTEEIVREIRRLEGVVHATVLASKYGVTRHCIRDIQMRKSWKWLA